MKRKILQNTCSIFFSPCHFRPEIPKIIPAIQVLILPVWVLFRKKQYNAHTPKKINKKIKTMPDELKHVTDQQQQKNWPQVRDGDELWLCFFKPRTVLETEAAYGSIRYSYGALDLLFTKKNPSLLKWPLLLQPSISAASNNLEGGGECKGRG